MRVFSCRGWSSALLLVSDCSCNCGDHADSSYSVLSYSLFTKNIINCVKTCFDHQHPGHHCTIVRLVSERSTDRTSAPRRGQAVTECVARHSPSSPRNSDPFLGPRRDFQRHRRRHPRLMTQLCTWKAVKCSFISFFYL